MEQQFTEFLQQFVMPSWVFDVIEKKFEQMRSTHELLSAKKAENVQQEITNLQKQQEKFELILENANNPKLHEKYAKKRSDLDEEITSLQQQVNQNDSAEDNTV